MYIALTTIYVGILLGTYHQYDTVAYPIMTKVTKTLKEKAKAAIGGLRFGQSLRSTENVLNSQQMGKYCLEVYLDGYKKMLVSANFPQPFDVHKLVEEIQHVYNSLLYRVSSHQVSVREVEKREGSLQEVRLKNLRPASC